MTRVFQVTTLLREHGPMTLDAICERIPEHSRRNLHSALQNAVLRGLVHLSEMGTRRGRGQGTESIWSPGPKPGTPAKPTRKIPVPPSCVWEMAEKREFDFWPPLKTGEKHRPLGSWTD